MTVVLVAAEGKGWRGGGHYGVHFAWMMRVDCGKIVSLGWQREGSKLLGGGGYAMVGVLA